MKSSQSATLTLTAQRLSRLHFWYVGLIAGQLIAFDAWKLIPPDAVLQRWSAVLLLFAVVTVVWYLGRTPGKKPEFYQKLVWGLIIADILMAGYLVYAGRGMASRAVALFAVPIVVAACLKRPSGLFASAALSAAAYWFAAIRYFTDFPSEGYKIELYGDLAFYSAGFFLLAAVLNLLISRPPGK